eukprot:SAG11_NODE_8619_length_995_cov_0.703125_1_plen_77_part_00
MKRPPAVIYPASLTVLDPESSVLDFRYLRHIDVLLDHGADVNAPNEFGATPLHWAAERGPVAPSSDASKLRFAALL